MEANKSKPKEAVAVLISKVKEIEELLLVFDRQLASKTDPTLQEQLEMKYLQLKKELEAATQERNQLQANVRQYEKVSEELKETINLQQHQIQSYKQQIPTLEEELRKLKAYIRVNPVSFDPLEKQKLRELDAKLNKKEQELSEVKQQLQRARSDVIRVQNELDSTRTRLSKALADQLTDGNAHIADLSDKNRPTKIQESYSDLYDNQWTNAFEDLMSDGRYGRDEKKTIEDILKMLTAIYKFCERKAKEQMDTLQRGMLMSSKMLNEESLPKNICRNLKDCRKATAEISVTNLYKECLEELRKTSTSVTLASTRIKDFVQACLEICWLMAVQNPPIVLNTKTQRQDVFNTDLFKGYTKSGPFIDFIVWPPVLLHEDGPVLCKGIAQGYEGYTTRSRKFNIDENSNLVDLKAKYGSYHRDDQHHHNPMNESHVSSRGKIHQAINHDEITNYDVDEYIRLRKKYSANEVKNVMGENKFNACSNYARKYFAWS